MRQHTVGTNTAQQETELAFGAFKQPKVPHIFALNVLSMNRTEGKDTVNVDVSRFKVIVHIKSVFKV